jgi:hypothetical protein
MLSKTLRLLALSAILSGCTTVSYRAVSRVDIMPEVPIAGPRVARELGSVCNGYTCPRTNDWLNELYLFKQEYKIYKGES